MGRLEGRYQFAPKGQAVNPSQNTVSAVVRTCDRPESLRRTIESLLAQSRLPDEIVIVNDGAEEVPADLANRVRAAGAAFKYCRISARCAPAARNRGMERAGGEILVMLDDDVLMESDCLARLMEMYRQAPPGTVAGIGAAPVEPPPGSLLGRRLWRVAAKIMGLRCWMPRVCASRYVALPARLRKSLLPGKALSGCMISLRREIASAYRFDENLPGYALGEDREFSCRVGQEQPLFLATDLTVLHDAHPLGRPDWKSIGRMLVTSTLYIAGKCRQRGPGSALLLGYEFVGSFLLHGLWGIGTRRGRNLHFAAGIAAELIHRVGGGMRKLLCGS